MNANAFALWLAQIRAPFLLLPVVLMAISAALALRDHAFHPWRFTLALFGVILAHAGVNLLNELSDYRTGIDYNTRRTPFSGGSGNLPAGRTTAMQVKWVTAAILTVALAIGVYLSWQVGWPLLAIIVSGGLIVMLYTEVLTKAALGELAAGIGLGSLVVIGGYYAQTGTITAPLLLISIPPGILTALLLLLNEFPDAQADAQGGRRHLVILLGPEIAAILYTTALVTTYFILLLGAIFQFFPKPVLLGLLTLPLAWKACRTALLNYQQFEAMVTAQGANVGLVLATDLLIAIGWML